MAEQIQGETRPRVVVRPAAKSERAQIADLLTRTFIHDPVMNWFGSVKFLVFDTNREGKSSSALKTIRGLAAFYTTVVNLFFLLGANIDVAVLRDHNRGDGEKIIGVAAWFEPGKEVNPSFWTLLRARPWKVTGTWGVRALKNIFAEYEPAAEKAAKRAFVNHKGISTNLKDSWHLTVLAVDPLYESQGRESIIP
ncbi:hypothetical protein OF83DRAFT_1111265 [Amylostereum chailletii]|nr:hypothetical protein OF83DRAFT_1111265 [Amylostereum chailletii]